MNMLRLEMADRLQLIQDDVYSLWVVDFPLVEYDDDSQRWHAIHHPFTAPKGRRYQKMDHSPGEVNANAYDMVINGVEIRRRSIRIHIG